MDGNSLLGSVIVIIGLYILLWGKKKEMESCASKVVVVGEDQMMKESQQDEP